MMKIWTTLLNGHLEMRSAAFPALIALLAALGAAHILVRTSTYGAALGNDAFNYLSAAESLAAGEGLLSPGGGQMTLYAPFFSMAMAFLSLFGIEPVDGGRFLNATAFGLLILVSGLYLSRRLESRLLALGVAVAVMASLPLSHVASTLMSEPLFILFTLLALMPLESFLNRRSGTPAPALVLSAVAALTRYIGVTLIISAVLMLLSRRNAPVRERLKHALVFGAISSLPLAMAMARNQLASGTLFGGQDRSGGNGSVGDSPCSIRWARSSWCSTGGLTRCPRSTLQLQHSPWLIAGLVLLLAAILLITPPSGKGVFRLLDLRADVPCDHRRGGAAHERAGHRQSILGAGSTPLCCSSRRSGWTDSCAARRRAGCPWSGGCWSLSALVGGSYHIGVSVRQNLLLTAEALESGYIGKSFNTAYWRIPSSWHISGRTPSPAGTTATTPIYSGGTRVFRERG